MPLMLFIDEGDGDDFRVENELGEISNTVEVDVLSCVQHVVSEAKMFRQQRKVSS